MTGHRRTPARSSGWQGYLIRLDDAFRYFSIRDFAVGQDYKILLSMDQRSVGSGPENVSVCAIPVRPVGETSMP
jgi:hypothetical protein